MEGRIEKAISVAILSGCAGILLALISGLFGQNMERQRAVDAGVAEWHATSTGKVEFRYKTGVENVGQAK